MFNPARVSAASLKKSKEGAVSTGTRASYTMGSVTPELMLKTSHDRAADFT